MDRVTREPDLGSTPEKLSQTLRTSMVRSRIEDPPLPPMREPIKRWLPRYWLTRLYLVGSLLTTFLAVYFMPGSILAEVMGRTPTARGLVVLLTALALVGLMDVVVNDLMPSGYSLRWLRCHRHWIFNGISLALLGLCYTIVRVKGWSPLLITFADDLAVALVIAPLDLFARHRENKT